MEARPCAAARAASNPRSTTTVALLTIESSADWLIASAASARSGS